MIATTNLFIALLAYPVLGSAVLTRRQDLSGVPACGQTCLITAATDSKIVGSCSLTDIPCLCNNQKFQNSVQNCALASCSTQDQVKMLTWATATCPEVASTAPASQAPAPTVAVPSEVAGELTGWPACGQTCLINTGSNSAIVGSCSLTDTACLCKDAAFMGAVTTCVASQCSLNDKLSMLKKSDTMCSTGASGSAAAAQATPAASATPATQETAEANANSVTQATPTASSAAAPTVPSQNPLVDFSANTSSVASYASANSTTASSAGSPTTNLTTSSATSSAGSPTTNLPTSSVTTNATSETSPATKFSCTGSWVLAFATIFMTLV